jgi:hypothetical protein
LAHHRRAIDGAARICIHGVHANGHLGVLHGEGEGGRTRPTGWIGRRRDGASGLRAAAMAATATVARDAQCASCWRAPQC